MIKYRKILSLLLVAVLTAGVAFWLRPNDRKRITKRFHQACSVLSKSESENPAVTAFKMLDFGNSCAASLTFEIKDSPISGTISNEVLISELARYRAMCDQIILTPLGVEVTLSTPTRATAECVVRAQLNSNLFSYDEIRHLLIRLQKIENSWKFTGVADDLVLVK